MCTTCRSIEVTAPSPSAAALFCMDVNVNDLLPSSGQNVEIIFFFFFKVFAGVLCLHTVGFLCFSLQVF